ncbi:hypothetical protein GE09DRAFT_496405 [Coniochaeta sp. 2T2.1]|nr:hypothetical protein GE09DRAFT_496405 [Coniochaeta sp. 2T2.1]
MPTTDRRRTSRRDYTPEYSDYSSYSDTEYRPSPPRRPRAPRRKSTLRDTIDRVSRGMGRLGINRSPSPPPRSRRHARVISPSPSPSRSPPPTSRSSRPTYNRHRSADSYYYPRPSSRSRNRRHGSSYSLSPPRTRRGESRTPTRRDRTPVDDKRFSHAARSALDAAVVEVMRVRKEPGKWRGGKGARVATAALGAAAVDAFVTNEKGNDPDKHGKRKTVESTLGGLLLNRVINGPRRELRKEDRGRR